MKFFVPRILFVFFLSLIAFTEVKIQMPTESQHRVLISPLPFQEYFSFGFQPVIADSLWLRAIQDMDYCDRPISESQCQNNSWLFRMLDSVTTLAPDFRAPFSLGPLALSVIISDIQGASKLFDKSVLAFPNDWKILSRAGFHALYEEKDKKKAAFLYEKAAKNGGPSYLFALANSLFLETDQKEAAKQLVNELLASQDIDAHILERVQEKLQKSN